MPGVPRDRSTLQVTPVKDSTGLVHIATSTPGPNTAGDKVAGTTRCGRWWAWSSMNLGRHYGGNLLQVEFSFGPPTCLACIDDRRPH
jgi:hypothetical protein